MVFSLMQSSAVENPIINKINQLSKNGVPFLFVFDFQLKKPRVYPLRDIDSDRVLYNLNGKTNCTSFISGEKTLEFTSYPVFKKRYEKAFRLVQQNINYGNSFLLNLTMPSRIETNYSLKDIFYLSKAKYKLWFKDQFVVFSPETFIKINDKKISSYPMKGTIDANLPDAKNQLLKNKKELAEHFTIVDLIRNDLSMVAKNVKVDRFQYIDHIKTNRKELLQMSSEISGDLPANYREILGNIIFKMLPAGSISGAPKQKTLEIIQEAEQYERGYYTGIFGIFDGENLDSGVMIRYIENTDDGMIYKSGGGITAKSKVDEEYQELIDKIYVPVAPITRPDL